MPEPFIFTLPSEILSRIVLCTIVDSKLLTSNLPPKAFDLLKLTHVSRTFREVVTQEPSLWAPVLFTSGVHEDFFRLMLERSSPMPFTIVVSIDSKFAQRPSTTVMQLLLGQMKHVENLVIHVSPEFQGNFARCLLSTEAPILRECVVVLHGVHARVNLGGMSLFGSQAPLLECIKLNGYRLPPNRFPKLCSVSLNAPYTYMSSNAASAKACTYVETLFLYRHTFRHLRHLNLCNAIIAMPPALRASSPLVPDSGLHQLELPLLETLRIFATAAVCLDLAQALSYPSICSCTIVVRRTTTHQRSIAETETAVKAAAQFVNWGLKLYRCWIFVHQGQHAIRLSTKNEESHVHLQFDAGWIFEASSRCPTTRFLELANLDSQFKLPSHVTSRNIFFASIWRQLASELSTPLRKISRLSLSLPSRQPNEPAVLHPLFLSLKNVQCIEVCEHAEMWGNPAFASIVSRTGVFPLLSVVGLSIERHLSSAAKLHLNTFLLARKRAIKEILLLVAPALISEAGFEYDDVLSGIAEELALAGIGRVTSQVVQCGLTDKFLSDIPLEQISL